LIGPPRLGRALLAILCAAWMGAAGAQTGSVAAGKTTYTAWCVGCHSANPVNDPHGVINGANNANFILNTWAADPNMQFLLQGALTDPVQAAADVAAYLGSLVGGGGTPKGQLQFPASVQMGNQTVGIQSAATQVKLTNVGTATVNVNSVTNSNAAEFPIANENCTGAAVPVNGTCKINLVFLPSGVGTRSTSLTVTSNGTGSPQSLVITGVGVQGSPPPPPAVNYQGLWWAAPAGSESGWGINLAHQGDTIFASWFTYAASGKGLWLVMTALKSTPGVYSGQLFTTTGPAFNAVPFNPAAVQGTLVGNATLSFSDANNGSFSYTVNGISQVKAITREVFGTLPTCSTVTGSLAAATNYQDLWWAAPAGSESGWGVNFTHQDNTIFATWFTYDVDGSPMWLVATTTKGLPGVYSGTLFRTTGPAFNAVPFNPANVQGSQVGTLTLTFSDGNNATFAYTVNGVAQQKAITREIFVSPGTVCH
jgi:hypothetical protein